jgi:molybdenum cofactor guanylyltransferase
MTSTSDSSIFILAGGKSTRMGTDKAFVEFNGRTLLERVLETARSVTRRVAIVGSPTKFSAHASVIEDVFQNCGPLAGIHAALQSSTSDLNLILAVDLPFVTRQLLQFLLKKAGESPTAIITVPRTAQGWQPLCAVYPREFAPIAEKSLRAGRYKIDALFEVRYTKAIPERELEAAGFSADLFRNLNSPEDLAQAAE